MTESHAQYTARILAHLRDRAPLSLLAAFAQIESILTQFGRQATKPHV